MTRHLTPRHRATAADLATKEVRAKQAVKFFAFLKRTGHWMARDGTDADRPHLWTVDEWEQGRVMAVEHDACAVRMVSSLPPQSVSFKWVSAMLQSGEDKP